MGQERTRPTTLQGRWRDWRARSRPTLRGDSCHDPSTADPRRRLPRRRKTTLLAQAAVRLSKLGHRVGLVANDQAADLVDSEVLKITGTCVEEVAGGCFCCRFPDMIAALDRLAQRDQADVLLGEPVGSCTDLAATVMQPLQDAPRRGIRPGPAVGAG